MRGKKILLHILPAGCLLLFCSLCFSQKYFTKIEFPGSTNFKHVTGITQDKQGYMWFATKKGMYRYDGYQLTTFKNIPLNANSLRSNLLESIFADDKGIIWIGTTGYGLDKFDPVTGVFTHFNHDENNPNSLANDTVTAIMQDRHKTLWIGTHKGLDSLDQQTGKFTHFQHNPTNPKTISSNQVRSLYQDSKGTIWIGTGSPFINDGGKPDEGGLNKMDKREGTFTKYLHNSTDTNSLTTNKVKALFEDSKGNFWVGTTGDGLHLMDRHTGKFVHYKYRKNAPGILSRPPIKENDKQFAHISFITEDATGALWIGTADAGIIYYSNDGKKTHYLSQPDSAGNFSDRFTWTSFTSRDGAVWISTTNGYLYKIDPFDRNLSFTPTNADVSNVLQTGETLWIPTTQGLLRKEKETAKLYLNIPGDATSIGNNVVQNIVADGKGNIWAATMNGLYYFDKQKETFRQFKNSKTNKNSLINNYLITVYIDRNSDLWIGSIKGLDKYNIKTNVFTHYKVNPNDTGNLNANVITTFLEDKKYRLWVGTWVARGLYKMNRENGTFKNYLPGVSVTTIIEDASGIIWVAGDDGLYRYDEENDLFTFFDDPVFSSGINNVISLVEDAQQNLWIGSVTGFFRINPGRNETSFFGKNYKVEGAEFSLGAAHRGEDGKLYFGTSTGYYSFFPKDLIKHTIRPIINITSFRLGDREVKPGKKSVISQPISLVTKITLPYDQNIFSFDFVAIDYLNPTENRHQYILENYDKHWRVAGSEKRAYYFDVPPGEYVFKVKAANSDGVWAEKSISIIIAPPWWQRWWAYLLFVVLAIGIVSGIIYLRSRKLLNEKKLLEEKVKLRTAEVMEQKEEIATQRDHLAETLIELKSTQSQLIQREKMASLGELTSGIAHEIQNPLNFINNFSEVNSELIAELKSEINSDNKEEALEIADNLKTNEQKISLHGKRADAIVKGMLQHSRNNIGTRELTDINNLVEEFLQLSYHGLRAKDKTFNATLNIELDNSLKPFNMVPQDIGRVLINLFNNAFYAVSEKKEQQSKDYNPTVIVTTKKIGNAVEIRIGDNGNGIPQNIIDKIFQPFFTTKPTGQGTGLGLSLSYDIVKAHGGEIKVETQEGKGTAFIIQLPVSS